MSLPAWASNFLSAMIVDIPPAEPGQALGEAIRLSAKLGSDSKRLLLQLLLAYDRVPANEPFDSPSPAAIGGWLNFFSNSTAMMS